MGIFILIEMDFNSTEEFCFPQTNRLEEIIKSKNNEIKNLEKLISKLQKDVDEKVKINLEAESKLSTSLEENRELKYEINEEKAKSLKLNDKIEKANDDIKAELKKEKLKSSNLEKNVVDKSRL